MLTPLARSLITILAMSLFAFGAHAQATTSTTCNTSGSITNCTSNTTDYDAQNRRAYEQGQQVGNAIGQGMAAAMQAHSFNKGRTRYCAAHPGQDWTYYRAGGDNIAGHCPSGDEKATETANLFMSKHRDFIPCAENSQAVTGYLEAKNLSPLEEKSLERGHKNLKKRKLSSCT